MSVYDQHDFEIRCEWGEEAVALLASVSDVVIIVDVLSFSTCVDIAVARGAQVFPFAGPIEGARDLAETVGGVVASRRGSTGAFTLSPLSLTSIPSGTKLVLPSPNGSTLSLGTRATPTIAGCLRNARAVAHAAQQVGTTISVIAAGERWNHARNVRFSFEDFIGAGAIISHLHGTRSPEAQAAEAAFRSAQRNLKQLLRECASGRELIAEGFDVDVALASEYNGSDAVPRLHDGAFSWVRAVNS
jgi:2-phosphosulfolactate phosphatase